MRELRSTFNMHAKIRASVMKEAREKSRRDFEAYRAAATAAEVARVDHALALSCYNVPGWRLGWDQRPNMVFQGEAYGGPVFRGYYAGTEVWPRRMDTPADEFEDTEPILDWCGVSSNGVETYLIIDPTENKPSLVDT
jgi:hypothetical protein